MAGAQAFETDFWKDAGSRKVWDEIVPGEPRKTLPYTLTREAIELYCKSVGETHPIYFDEAYARTTRYGGLIAPPSTLSRRCSTRPKRASTPTAPPP